MQSGIYLGPGRKRLPGVLRLLVWIVAAGTLAHALVFWRAHTRVRAERAELVAAEEALSRAGSTSETSPDARHLARMQAWVLSGAVQAVSPTDVLALLSEALPDGVALVSVAVRSTPAPSLTLDATAADSRQVTELQERMARSARVDETRLLEDDLAPDGGRVVRLQVDLAEGSSP